ncbi:unnamed protein product [Onchocerca flexuosa]|uniref:RSN1_7TM domain-containing protein n=1 Tax=Onchocerca flexuosa TaxID=387005 RepID=A0A183I1L7_9BILA|nr:unnamed protein product [Onchocerca flexuosa]
MLLVSIAVILIFTAPGVCYTRYINDLRATDEICPNENFLPMGVNRWSNGVHFQHRGQNVWGQLAIVIIAILFALPPLGLSCFQIATGASLFYMAILYNAQFATLISSKAFFVHLLTLLQRGFCLRASVDYAWPYPQKTFGNEQQHPRHRIYNLHYLTYLFSLINHG